jgi:hypothetical protein
MTSRVVGTLTALALVTAVEAGAQPPPLIRIALGAGTASISGRVTDDRGVPVEGADVTAIERAGGTATVKTDAHGHYRFDGIPEGQYSIQAALAGYVRLALQGWTGVPGFLATASVVPDQHRDDVHLVLPREGRIRGRVVDTEGRPVEGVSVGAGRRFRDGLVRTAMTFRVQPGSTRPLPDGISGADGSFEINGLPAGDLLVEANPGMAFRRPNATVAYESTFYPDAASAELATPVTVEAGRVTSGITIVMVGIRLGTLSMRLAPDPQTLTDLQCNVVAFPGRQIRSVKIDETLAQAQGLKEGRYAVWARGRAGQERVAAFMMLDYRVDLTEVPLVLAATGRITGRLLAARGGLPPVDGVRVESALTYEGELVDHLAVDAEEVAPDGRFVLEGQFGARRVSVRGLPPGWQMREIRLGRQDITQGVVDVPPGAMVDIVIVVDRQ